MRRHRRHWGTPRAIRRRAGWWSLGCFVLVAATDQFEQQVGMAVGIGEIADLVDDQKVGAGVVRERRRKAESLSRAASSPSKWPAVVNSTVCPWIRA